jgi:regulatory protein
VQQPPPPSKRKAQPGARARALKLLARREHTRRELAARLSGHVEDGAELEALLDEFTARGWLSEDRVVEQVLHAKRGRFGLARIRQALVERGVPEALIGPALDGLKASEVDAARGVWTRKFRSPPTTTAERARQVRFLQSRGFSVETALRVVRGGDFDTGE